MKQEIDIHRDIWGPYMTAILNLWSSSVFKTVNQFEALGIYTNNTIGTQPLKSLKINGKQKLTQSGLFLNLLPTLPKDYDKVKYFDIAAEEYELATHYFKSHFINRALDIVKTQVDSHFYILDASCGPGYEANKLSKIVIDGEVIAIDLSKEMIKRAYRNAKLDQIKNMGFAQLDVNTLPAIYKNHFDVIFCSLSLHYYKDLETVFKQFYKALSPQGKLILIEPQGSFSQQLTSSTVKKAMPHFQKFYTYDEINTNLEKANLNVLYWEEIQQGIGLTIAIK